MKQHRILIVDKEPKNLNILENNFLEADFEVDKATSDYEALKHISAKHYDVILSEVTGPSIDGYHILEQLQRDSTKAEIPVVFLTQKSDIWNRVKSFKLGAKDYIVKPMHVKEIVGRINMLLKRLEKQRSEELLSKKKFTGRIEDFTLADLIETFGTERKTGVLSLVNQNGTAGRVYFFEGKVVGAETRGMKDESAIYKMMAWDKGRFSMLFTNVDERDSCKISNLGLLLEGAKRMEQRDELLKHIPSLEAVVVTTSNFRKILEQKALSQDLKQFLDLFDGERTISRIIDESPEDELTVMSRIAKLSNLGFLHVLRDFSTEKERTDIEELEPVSSEELERETRAIFSEESEPHEATQTEPTFATEMSGEPDQEQVIKSDVPEVPAEDVDAMGESAMEEEKESALEPGLPEEEFDSTIESGELAMAGAEEPKIQKDEQEVEMAGQEVAAEEEIPEESIFTESTTSVELDESAEPFADFTVPDQTDSAAKPVEPLSEAEEIEPAAESERAFESFPDTGESEQARLPEKPAEEGIVVDNGRDQLPTLETHFNVQTDPFAGFETEEPGQQEGEVESVAHEALPDSGEHPADKLLTLDKESGFESSEAEPEAIATEAEAIEEPEAGPKPEAGPVPETPVKPDAEQIKERYSLAKGCILVLGTDEVHRKTFVDSLAKGFTSTADTGLKNVSPVYYGTAEFKGQHFLNLISFSIKNEFTPLVEYFAPKTLAYVLIIDQEQPDWPYLNYLITVLRNNLHKPAKLVFTSKKHTEAEIRSKLFLKPGEGIAFCDHFDDLETKKIIFSLFVK